MLRRRTGALLPLAVLLLLSTSPLGAQPPRGGPPSNVPDGLSINEPGAFEGYTLVAPMNSKTTYLVDLEGRIVNEWTSAYTPALSAYLLPNGNLLRPGAEQGFGPGAGGRIQEIAWDGTLVWDYSFGDAKRRPHHDICPLPNGNVLVVASDPKTPDEAIAAGRRPELVRSQLLPDCILEVKPTGPTSGEIVWQWCAWDHLVQDVEESKPNYGDVSEHPELIDVNFGSEMMDRMLRDPQQLAQLRTLGYVGGAAPPGGGANAGGPPPAGGPEDAPAAAPGRPEGGPPGDAGPGPDGGPRNGGRGRGGSGGPGGGPGNPFEGDWMHVNSIAYNAKLDQIMISVHEFHEVWIIDHSTSSEEAASHSGGRSGKGGDLLYRWGNPKAYRNGSNADQRLFAQHCAHWIAEGLPGAGNMLVFNNGNGRPGGDYSSIDEIVLPVDDQGSYQREEYTAFGPVDAIWSYSASDKTSFYSMLISGAQRLPNGNTLICSGNQAILFEVTPEKEVVWRYKHPGGGFGGPGGPGGFRPGEMFPSFLLQMLNVQDDQRPKLENLQKEVDVRLEKLLTADQLRTLREPMPFGFGGPPGGPGGFGPPGGGPGGFGPPPRPEGPPEGEEPPAAPPGDGPPRGEDRLNSPPGRLGRDGRGRGGPDGQGGPRGPGGPGGFRPPKIGDVIPAFVIGRLELSETQQSDLAEIQKFANEELAKIWTDEQKQQIDDTARMFAGGPRFGPPGGGPGFGPPGGGPGGPPGGFGPPGGGPDGFGPPDRPGGGPNAAGRPDGPGRRGGREGRGRGGPGGPGGPGGGPGGIFRVYRYGADFPGLVGKTLTPGKKLDEVAAPPRRPPVEGEPPAG